MTMDELKRKVEKKGAEWTFIRQKVRSDMLALEETRKKLKYTEKAQKLAQQVAQFIQEQAHHQISHVVTQCLQSVFDDPYELKIVFNRMRGRTEAVLLFTRDGFDVDPMSASGGGVVDVASFALRLSCLMLSQPPLKRVLILDEPFKFLSIEYRERMKKMLEKLATELKIQIVMVTHIEEFKTGKVIELGDSHDK